MWNFFGYFVNAVIVNTPNNPDKLNLVLEGFYTADRNFTLPTFAPPLYLESLVKLQSEFDT